MAGTRMVTIRSCKPVYYIIQLYNITCRGQTNRHVTLTQGQYCFIMPIDIFSLQCEKNTDQHCLYFIAVRLLRVYL